MMRGRGGDDRRLQGGGMTPGVEGLKGCPTMQSSLGLDKLFFFDHFSFLSTN
jgi:hypothetical protein